RRKESNSELLVPSFQESIQNQQEITENIDNIVEISANETKELADINEEDEVFSLLVGDIIHLAVDSNAKWDRITLFNELPLL
ncbi:18747_t:CDS:2, partial [Gigaspora rosea]